VPRRCCALWLRVPRLSRPLLAQGGRILSLVDCEEGEFLCPQCGSKEVERCWSAFNAITSEKSA
jgi:hypothetical protein